MINPILSQLSGNQQNPQSNIMLQAVGAMMRGESPQQFLQNLAQTNPQLQGLDLSNPNKAAEDLCKKNGKDFNTEKANIMSKIGQFIGNSR